MNTRMCYGNRVNFRQAREFHTVGEGDTTPEVILEAELIDLGENDEIVDLTCESLEPAVIDLTHHDSVVFTEERRRARGNTRSLQGQTGSCVVSSDEGLIRDRDVYMTNSAYHNVLEEKTLKCTLPGYIRCRICMDGYSEIELSRRQIYSTECGHIFCSQCLCNSLKHTKNCPVCLKKISCHQYHRIYI